MGEPVALASGPTMDGGGTIATTKDGRDTEDDDIDELVFAIEGVSRIVEALEVGGNRADIDELGHGSTP